MRLVKESAGEYQGFIIKDGCNVRMEVSYGECMRGFTYSLYVNERYMEGDGWTGLRLKDIKQALESNIEDAIKEYNKGY